MHVSRQGQPAEQNHRPEAVYHVIDIETVFGTLLLAVPRQGSIEAVAEPVEGERANDQQKCIPVMAGQGIGGSRHHLRPKSDRGQVVGVD